MNLACAHLGVVPTRSDAFFDGTLGPRLVKVVPFDHPITPVDLDELAREPRNRSGEDRDVTVVGPGRQLAGDPWLADHNRKGAPNQIEHFVSPSIVERLASQGLVAPRITD